ncbi:hypothetical protein AUC69_15455 [Methyloceanibacter superfactus]|uniref:RND efflux pump membrane fusion protein barrel-sandwich domain-containing protein n=1 Tax=Methyloceanibacter superfactus TaxID=1774969 RepID=A0A1E3VSA5_9HYPH|nr:hypothetical protein [Methyloceanibacter superfactus]ODR96161.1 hypothetical protein AUC69_15455 [Methyloceanibacter superfactus]
MSTKQADIIAKITDFKVRAESVSKLLPLAERREAEAAQAIRQFDTLLEGKYVTSVRYEEALRANYEATRERVTLLTQGNVLKEELTSLDRARDDADDALSKLQAIYADGLVHSPVNGSIGSTIPSVGTVYRPGDPILSIYSGEPMCSSTCRAAISSRSAPAWRCASPTGARSPTAWSPRSCR